MRIAMLVHGYPWLGGAERQLQQLAPLLSSSGTDVHVVTRRHAGQRGLESVGGVPVHRIDVPQSHAGASAAYTSGALRVLRKLRPDVVHSFELLSPTTTGVLAKRLLGTPLVVKILSAGELEVLSQRRLGSLRVRTYLHEATRFAVVSAEIDAMLAGYGVARERRVRIPNGVDAGRFRASTPRERDQQRRALGLPTAGPIVIYTGRLSPEKGVSKLLAAWGSVQHKRPDASLLILGSGPEELQLRQSAPAATLFAGAVEDVAPYLAAADVFVLPSFTEGMSNSLLEAMASGLGIVASAVGGNVELTDGGRLARLTAPGDVEGLATAIHATIRDVEQHPTLGTAARVHVRQRYTLDLTASRLLELYRELAASTPVPKGSR